MVGDVFTIAGRTSKAVERGFDRLSGLSCDVHSPIIMTVWQDASKGGFPVTYRRRHHVPILRKKSLVFSITGESTGHDMWIYLLNLEFSE